MGLMLAEPGFHTRCFVEWEEYPRSDIIAAQRAGYFAPAPIWDDLTTFDAKPIAGAIDTLLAGYPCQPFSMAGQRKGADDPRHLWPHVARVARDLGPSLRWIFLENVPGHVTLGAEAVLRELRDMGFTPAAGLFSAEEVGAPHERQRWFCVAYREGRGCGIVGDAAQPGRSGYADRGDKPVDDAQDSRGPIHARSRQPGQPAPDLGGAGCDVANASVGRCAGSGAGQDQQPRRTEVERASDTMADASGADGQWRGRRATGRARHSDVCGNMADASGAGLQGREQPGSHDQRHGPFAHGSTAERGSPWLFPPGPGDADAWAAIIDAAPDLSPAFARRDAAAAILHFAALLDPDTADAVKPIARGISQPSQLAALGEQAGRVVEQAQALTRLRNLADGLAQRTRALRLLGNGVCPLAAGYAWRTLAASHGLGVVDLGTAGDHGGTAADEPVRGGVM